MEKFSLKNNKALIFQVIIISAEVILLAVTIPQIGNMVKLSKNVTEKRKLLNYINDGIKNFDNIKKEAYMLEGEREKLISQFPSQRELPVSLELVSRLAKRNNLKIISMEPQKFIDDGKQFCVAVPLALNANCSYHDLGRFINDLEFAEKFVRISDLKIKSDNEDLLGHMVIMTLTVYCFRENEANTVLR